MPRYERKYRIDQLEPGLIEQWVRHHPASFRPLHPERQINNVYFDTCDLAAYQQNLMGVADRRKIRLRWYGEGATRMNAAQLEIKSRSNETGSKEVILLGDVEWSDWSKLLKQVQRLQPSQELLPVLSNSYRRKYYGTGDRHFRLTVDRQLTYRGLWLHAGAPDERLFARDPVAEEGVTIVELKYEQSLDDRADHILQYILFRQSRNSKYVNGVQLLYG